MNFGAGNLSRDRYPFQLFKIPWSFPQNRHPWTLVPRRQGCERQFERRRRIVDARMRCDGDKFMQAGPWDRPSVARCGQARYQAQRLFVPFAVFAMAINQQIGVDGNHEPTGGWMASSIACHPFPANSGCKPFPLNVTGAIAGSSACPSSFSTVARPSSTTLRSVVFRSRARSFARSNKSSEISKVVFTMGNHITQYGLQQQTTPSFVASEVTRLILQRTVQQGPTSTALLRPGAFECDGQFSG